MPTPIQPAFSRIARVVVLAAVLITAPVTIVAATPPAYADCGDPGQPPCTGPVPTEDEVQAVLAKLTDSNIPAANKGDVVAPPFAPDEAATIDQHLNRMSAHYLPLNFVVTDIQPAPNDFAGVTWTATGPIPFYLHTYPRPAVFVDQGGHWLITHDSAVTIVNVVYECALRCGGGGVPFTR